MRAFEPIEPIEPSGSCFLHSIQPLSNIADATEFICTSKFEFNKFDDYSVNRNFNIINEIDGSTLEQVNASPSLPEGRYIILSAYDLNTYAFDATPISELTNGRWDYRRELLFGGSQEVQELSGGFTYEILNEFDDSTYSTVSVEANLGGVSNTGVPFDGVLYQTGTMTIQSETDNSQLILDPATGDQSTVAITIISDNGDSSTTVYPWSTFNMR